MITFFTSKYVPSFFPKTITFLFFLITPGIPTPTTKWLKNGAELSSAVQNAHLDLVSISKSDAGNYTCVVSNINGTIHHTTQLTVFGKIIILQFLHGRSYKNKRDLLIIIKF